MTIVVTGAYTDGIEVPDVEGVPLQQAKQKLEAAGLGVRARRDVGAPLPDDVVYTSDPRPGDIVRQTRRLADDRPAQRRRAPPAA